MIDIKELSESDIGRWVKYVSRDWRGDVIEREYGRIKSWNNVFIFVIYRRPGRNMEKFKEYTPVATHPRDLEWIDV